MSRKLIEYKISDTDIVSYSGYNSTKTVLGPMIYRYSATSLNDYYIGPPTIGYRLISQDTGLNGFGPISIIKYTDDIDWVFSLQNPSNPGCRLVGYSFDKKTSNYTYLGMINSTTHVSTNSAWTDLATSLDYYTAGTVSVEGKVVLGSGTDWGSNYMNAGNRIGFGSTNPQEISTWYEISNVPLETNKFNNTSFATEVDSLGRIYVAGGAFTSYSYFGTAFTNTRIIRLNPDGSPDTTFQTGTGFNGIVRRIKIDPTNNNNVYFVGDFTTYSSNTVNYITKLNASDGSINTLWSGGTSFNNFVYDIDIDSLGGVYVTGIFTSYKGVATSRLCKLTSNGILDTSFSGYSPGLIYNVSQSQTVGYCLAVEPVSNKIYVGGLFDRWNSQVVGNAFNVIRINTNGSVDYTYTATTQFNNYPQSLTYDSINGGLYIGGQFTTYSGLTNNYIIKTTTGGTKDTSFDNSTGFNSLVSKIRLKNDGKLFVSGSFTTYKGTTQVCITKLNSNGSLDTTFNAETNTLGLQYLGTVSNLSDGFAFNSTTDDLYVTNQVTSTLFGGLIAYSSGGTINQNFYGINTQRLNLVNASINYSAGTPYVIEDLRFYAGRIGGNSSQYGTYVIKGVKITDFVSGTTNINATTNGYYGINTRTCYWLPLTLNTSAYPTYGVVLDDKSNYISQYLYQFNGTTLGIYYRDVRNLYRISNTSTMVYPDSIFNTSLNFDSGLQTYNNPIITTMQSGSASGIKSMYYPRTGSIRQIPMGNIQNNINPLSFPDSQLVSEIPPGGTTTYPTNNAFFNLSYMPEIDRLIISTNGTASKSYITQFNTTYIAPSLVSTFWSRDEYNKLSYENSFERSFLVNNQQLQGPLSNINAPKYPDTQGSLLPFIRSNEGWLHYNRGVATTENIIYSIPLSADEQYVSTSNNVIITPKYVIPNLISITGFYLNTLKEIGSGVFSQSPEPIFTDFRTIGIDDNSGSWTTFNGVDDLNGLLCNNTTNSITIQFRIRFRVAGINCYPNRLYGFTFTYEDDTIDSHYSSSVSKSSLSSKIFAFNQISLFGGTIPDMRVRVYNANTGEIILYDTVTDSNLGVWEYSTDGTNWNPWSFSADSVGNYIRYTANYLPSNYKLRVGLNTI
jgi:uncharacterized delta-60 repeat protein